MDGLDDHELPPLILNSILKPATGETTGRLNMVAHVFTGVIKTGAAGKMETLTVLLVAYAPEPALPAAFVPHAAVKA